MKKKKYEKPRLEIAEFRLTEHIAALGEPKRNGVNKDCIVVNPKKF